MPPAPPKHFLQFRDFSLQEFDHLFARTRWIKERFKRYELYQPLRDRTLAMVFEKASTRTRVSFEAGMNQLGGIAINLNRGDTQLSRGEPIEDVARVISRMVDVVMIRTFEQSIIERFAAHSRVPVINGLTNEYHPCQILADIYTYVEHRGSIRGTTVAWIGDSNNVLLHVAAGGGDLRLPRARLDAAGLRSRSRTRGVVTRGHFEAFADPMDACRGADLVTTDVWTSMGFEAENEARKRDFAALAVDAAMMRAGEARRALHALPARAPRRGSHRRSDRRAAERRVGRGREPAARAEGAARVSRLRPRQALIVRGATMIDHTGVSVSDVAKSKAFYRAALAPLGYAVLMEFERCRRLRRRAEARFLDRRGRARTCRRSTSRSAPTRARRSTRSTRRRWPPAAATTARRACGRTITRTTTARSCSIPDGHNIEAVCHAPA